jgi:hypothetical protein
MGIPVIATSSFPNVTSTGDQFRALLYPMQDYAL